MAVRLWWCGGGHDGGDLDVGGGGHCFGCSLLTVRLERRGDA